MTKSLIRIAAVTTVSLAILLGGKGAAFAGPPPPPGADRLAIAERHLQTMEIDADAMATLLNIIDQARIEQEDLRQEVRAAHETIRALLEQDTPDADAVLAQVEEIGSLETEERKHEMAALLEMRPYVTAEQWQELVSFRPPAAPRHARRPRPGRDAPEM